MDQRPGAQRGTVALEGPAGAAPEAASVMAGVAGELAGVRSRARLRLCVLSGAWLVTAVLAVGLGLVLFDYLARLPAVLRGVLLAIGVVAAGWEFRRAVLPALRFWPSLTEVALRLESSEAGRRAGLPGVLAAGLELGSTSGAGGSVLERRLSARVADEAMRRFDPSIAASVFAPGRVRGAALVLAGAVAVIGAWSAARPELARIGVVRLAAPWMGVQWPRRTEVVNATGGTAHAIDSALPLRAMLTRTDRGPGRTDVWVNYRIVRGGEAGPAQRALMTAQQQRAASVIATASELDGRSMPVTGEMYERLVEPAGLLSGEAIATGGAGAGGGEDAGPPELEYWFQTSDDRTEAARVALVERPGVTAAAVEVSPPAYAAAARGGESWWTGERTVTLGERGAAVGPILAGSTVRLRLELNKPVPAAPAWRDDEPGAEALRISGEGARWVMEWTAGVSRRLSVGLEDSYGLRSAEEVAFGVDVLADQSPGATVVDPARDESVLATAVIDVVGEGRDDIGLVWVALERERIAAAPSPAPADGAVDPLAGPAELARLAVAAESEDARQARVTGVLDLSELGVKAGDEVRVTTVARDIFADEAGAGGHEAVRSTPRRLRIITESELVEQLQSELAGVRQSAIRLDREQAQAAEMLERAGAESAASPELRRRQWSIGEGLRPQSAALTRLAARAERNGLQDKNLELMLESAAAIVARAGEASDRATSAMDRAGERPSEAQGAAKEATEAQQGVREELARLVDLLESGKDGWAVRRAIEKLLAEQKELSRRTDELGAQTVGRPMSELTPGQRDELNRLAQQQREASAKAGAALDQILSRARQMAESDPAQAEAMMEAARRAQERGLQESMEQAAEEIARNKTQSGSDYQEQSEEALAQMLGEMENTEAKREEVLRRVLTGLIRSIEELVKRQQGDLEAIARAEKIGVETLAKSMIDLRVRTLAVGEEARGAGREGIKVVAALAAAGDAQTTAIGALRASPADTGGADASERVSLEALKEALEQARKLDEQSQEREQARKRGELRQAYAQALLTQRDLRQKASEFASKELNRRDRAVLRGLGERQETQRTGLEELRAKSEELKEAGVFQFAHKRLDDLLKRIGTTLSGGEMNTATAAGLTDSERMLESLVEALKEEDKKSDFNEGSDGGGGGGGGGEGGEAPPAIPPIAELRLLKLIQQEIAGRTRAGGDAEAVEQLGLDQQELTKYARELIERMKKQEREQGAGGGP